jgi:hypothetical protein
MVMLFLVHIHILYRDAHIYGIVPVIGRPSQIRCSLQLIHLHDINVENLDIFLRFLLVRPRILDFMNHIQALRRTPENCVLPIQPRL